MELYTEAAAVLEKLENKQGSVKSLVFASDYKNVRQLYALVCESLKYQSVLQAIFKGCNSLQREETLDSQPHLATALLYEHLIGKGLGRAGRIRSCIVKHKSEIQAVCSELLKQKGVTSLADLLSSQCQALNNLPIPRYVRVNFLKTTVDDVIAAFVADGWIWHGTLNLDSFQSEVVSLGQERFARDPFLPDLLVFPPGTDLHDHPLTTAGNVVLQDRASCFPAHVLSPPQGATVLDCCAAPGNKTSHTASLLANSGKILAYERDVKRMSLLQQQLRKTGVTNTKTVHQDFLSVDPHQEKFVDVQYILVDPSCSGSGIMNRMDHLNPNSSQTSTSSQRLLSLQRFQISILKHALKFPAAQRVVYSTCSIHEEENEAVVAEVAEQVSARFQVKKIYPEFSHRGKGSVEILKHCLRMSPKKDLTNGFFVACFERIKADRGDDAGVDAEENGEQEAESHESLQTRKIRKRKCAAEGCDKKDLDFLTSDSAADFPQAEHKEEDEESKSSRRKKKKRKKSNTEKLLDESGSEQPNGTVEPSQLPDTPKVSSTPDSASSKKTKKKKKKQREAEQDEISTSAENKDHKVNTAATDFHFTVDVSKNTAKKKKKRNTSDTTDSNLTAENIAEPGTVTPKAYSKTHKGETVLLHKDIEADVSEPRSKKKRCKHQHKEQIQTDRQLPMEELSVKSAAKIKKHKKGRKENMK